MFERLPPAALGLALTLLSPGPASGQADELSWEFPEPDRIVSLQDVEHEVLDDHSILAVGAIAARDTVIVDYAIDVEGITAIRVEALRDERLPGGGPGLGAAGVFKVAEVRVGTTVTTRRKSALPIPIVAAAGDPEPPIGRAWHAADANVQTAWGPNAATTDDLAASFVLAEPLPRIGRSILRVEIDQTHVDDWCLGRFRVGVTRASGVAEKVGAAGAEVDARLASQIDASILKGVNALLRAQQLDGSWRYLEDEYRTGSTALAVYTLMKCGLSREHPSVERGIEYVLAHPGTTVYVASVQIMALGLHDGRRHHDRIAELVERLEDWDVRGWAYPTHPSTEVDLSNTQYAMLALRSARQAGVEVPDKPFRNAAKITLKHREKNKGSDPATGFGYRIGGDATGAMTAAGITILAIAAAELDKNTDDFEEAIDEAVMWLAREFSLTRNPRPSRGAKAGYDGQDSWWLYYLYGIERVAGLLDLDRIGPHDWFGLGAQHLVEHQNDQGLWKPIHGGGAAQELGDSCFALLFLSRATDATTGEHSGGRRPTASAGGPDDPVQVMASGDAPWRVWIQGYSTEALDLVRWPDDDGLRVQEVRWELMDEDGAVLEVLQRVDGVTDRDALLVRFPVELRFRDRGSHLVRATVVTLQPDGEHLELHSKTVDLHTEFVDREELLEYARQSDENLLAGAEKRITVSSELNGTWGARRAADGRQALGWISKDDDDRPWIKIELEDPIRADTLRLSRAHEPWSTGPWRTGRIARVAISIDGDSPFEAELIDDDWTKTVIPLPRRAKIESIEIRVREVTRVHPDHPDYAGVGFGEVELIDSQR